MVTPDAPEPAFHVKVDYVDPDDPERKVRDVEFVATRADVYRRLCEVVAPLNMDSGHRDRMLAGVSDPENIHHASYFLETDPVRRVCLYIHNANGKVSRAIGW